MTGKHYKGYSKEYKRIKRSEHYARKALRDQLTPQEQIRVLDERLGKGKGAIKERARLAKQIEKAQKA